jgi:nucleoside-diphosphate-sugar epimerase
MWLHRRATCPRRSSSALTCVTAKRFGRRWSERSPTPSYTSRPSSTPHRTRRSCTTSTSTAPTTFSRPRRPREPRRCWSPRRPPPTGRSPTTRFRSRRRPVRGVPALSYARDKTEADRVCQLWAARYPDRTMSIVRPCVVFGPNVDNYLVRLWTRQPFAADPGTIDDDIQFVHEDDVVEAITALLMGRHGGAYNLALDRALTMRDCAELIRSPIRTIPMRVYRGLARAMWAARLSEARPARSTSPSIRGSCRMRSSSARPAGALDTRAGRPSRSRCARTASSRPRTPRPASGPVLRCRTPSVRGR